MDIQILLALESFREGFGSIFRDFLFHMTLIAETSFIPLLLATIYWCISKEMGTYMLMGYHWNRLINGFLKITVCAYRPWIRDPNLIPDNEAITSATGYSFPSGHSTNAASAYGGFGIRKDLRKSIRIMAWILVILVPFSRIYFCVHTPQDVMVGTFLSLSVMCFALKVMPFLEKKNMDIVIAGITIIVGIIIAIYASIKSYPVDYDAEGKLLVDGMKMAVDTYKSIGCNVGFFVGLILERRYIKFSTDNCDMQTRLARLIIGVISFYFVYYTFCPVMKSAIGGNAGIVISCFFQMLYISFLYPVFIKLSEKRHA